MLLIQVTGSFRNLQCSIRHEPRTTLAETIFSSGGFDNSESLRDRQRRRLSDAQPPLWRIADVVLIEGILTHVITGAQPCFTASCTLLRLAPRRRSHHRDRLVAREKAIRGKAVTLLLRYYRRVKRQ